MKKLVLLAAMLLVGAFAASAQTAKVSENITLNGTSYTTVSTRSSSGASSDIETPYTWSSSRDSVSHKIYLHQYVKGDNAGKWTCYVFKASKKTGNQYKYYIPDGQLIAEDIIKRDPKLIKK